MQLNCATGVPSRPIWVSLLHIACILEPYKCGASEFTNTATWDLRFSQSRLRTLPSSALTLLATCFMLLFCFAYSSTLKMDVACFSETSADFNRLHGVISQKIQLFSGTLACMSHPNYIFETFLQWILHCIWSCWEFFFIYSLYIRITRTCRKVKWRFGTCRGNKLRIW
jgi:hypothetical protein